MTATLEDVRAALAQDVTDATDLRTVPYLADQVNPPMGMIDVEGPEPITFSDAGKHQYTFTLLYFEQRTSERAAQMRCDELRDPFHDRSLKLAIDNGTAMAALEGIDYPKVLTPGGLTPVRIGAVDYLVAEFPIEIVIHQEDS